MDPQVVHLRDRRARYFYGYRVRIGRAGRGGFRDIGAEYQTLGGALLAAEYELRFRRQSRMAVSK
jgi:hypothetical protein